MRVINFGSLNVDHVYSVEQFVKPGETIGSQAYQKFVGGKGLNQSIALARAGATVSHAGSIGADGAMLRNVLMDDGVDVSSVFEVDQPSGHAIIQVDPAGENCILLHGGANQCNAPDMIDSVFDGADPGDMVLLQNEINDLPNIINHAAEKGLTIVFNPAPMSRDVLEYPLHNVDYLILNQTEATALTLEDNVSKVLETLGEKYTNVKVILTLGSEGAVYQDTHQTICADAFPARAIDTTGAGDTFIGYFLAELACGASIATCLKTACKAASICVQRAGASASIPYKRELEICWDQS